MTIEGGARVKAAATLKFEAMMPLAFKGVRYPISHVFLPGEPEPTEWQRHPARRSPALPTYSVATMEPQEVILVRLAYLFPMSAENVQAFVGTLRWGLDNRELIATPSRAHLTDRDFRALFSDFVNEMRAFDGEYSQLVGWQAWGLMQNLARFVVHAGVLADTEDVNLHDLLQAGRYLSQFWDRATETYFDAVMLARNFTGAEDFQVTMGDYRNIKPAYGGRFNTSVRRVTVGEWVMQAKETLEKGGSNLKLCPRCRRIFWQRNRRQVYCSDACRVAFFNAKKTKTSAGVR